MCDDNKESVEVCFIGGRLKTFEGAHDGNSNDWIHIKQRDGKTVFIHVTKIEWIRT